MTLITGPINLMTDLRVRILTVNLHKGFSVLNRRFVLPQLRNAVREVAADIVFLQEVIGEHTGHQTRYPHWPESSQYEYLADSLWNDFAYGRNAVYPEGHHGNALLSKFPIASNTNVDATFSRSEQRGLLYCCLTLPDQNASANRGLDACVRLRQLHTICVHLSLRERHRQQQIKLLCALIAELPPNDPVVVAGDFNDWRMLGHDHLVNNSNLVEVFVAAFGMPATTFPSRWPVLRLDRIYVRNIQIHRPVELERQPWSHLSDHAPLAAELDITALASSTFTSQSLHSQSLKANSQKSDWLQLDGSLR